MAATGKAGWDDMSAPRVPGFVKVPFGDLNAVAAAINVNTTAVMLEPIQGGTFNGNPLMTAAGLAVWPELSKPGFMEAVVTAGRHLTQALNKLSAKHGFGQVRGRGLLLALDLRSPVAGDIAAAALDNGLTLNAPRPDTLRFVPALNVSHEEIDQMLEILDSVIR